MRKFFFMVIYVCVFEDIVHQDIYEFDTHHTGKKTKTPPSQGEFSLSKWIVGSKGLFSHPQHVHKLCFSDSRRAQFPDLARMACM